PQGLYVAVELGTQILKNNRDEKPKVPDAAIWKLKEDPPAVAEPPNAASPTIAETQAPQVRRLAIRDLDGELLTVIELLSPANKHGAGAVVHQRKRLGLIESGINLVEIDLVRQWGLAVAQFEEDEVASSLASENGCLPPHAVLVFRASTPHVRELYGITYTACLPSIRVPLSPEQRDIWLNLQELAETAHHEGQFDLVTRYQNDPEPPLSPEEIIWLDQHLKSKGLR
ncbi:MAG: DUF4058 family protein, partial [Prosthecobacter sp.]|nr:DUF4058 family protein [Prosthecobacter sp.]